MEASFRFFYVIFMNLFRAPFMITRMRYYADHPELYTVEQRYALGRRAIRIMKHTGLIRTRATGTENLPEEGGYLIYSNHQGKYDALGILSTHDRPCSFILDDKVSHGILIREFSDLLGAGRIKLNDLKQILTVFKERAARVAAGERCIIFPEGVYANGKKNELDDFKPGSFKLAKMAKSPIVPVAIYDSYKVFNSFHPGPVKTYVRYLPPIPYEEFKDKKTAEIAAMVRARIADAMEDFRRLEKKGTLSDSFKR